MTLVGAEMWDERYGREGFAYGLAPNAFLASKVGSAAPGARALSLGDGEGRNGVFLATRGFAVDTLDLSERGVAKARRLAAERGVRVNAQCADAVEADWPAERYDLIALIYLHLPPPLRRRLHRRALGALAPEGVIVLEAFRPEQVERRAAGARGGPRDLELLYRLGDLREDFADGRAIELAEAEVDLAEGELHAGPSAVVRAVIARR